MRSESQTSSSSLAQEIQAQLNVSSKQGQDKEPVAIVLPKTSNMTAIGSNTTIYGSSSLTQIGHIDLQTTAQFEASEVGSIGVFKANKAIFKGVVPPNTTNIRIVPMRLPGIDVTPRYELATLSLANLLHQYFNPLDNYTDIAKTLFGTAPLTHHFECHYPLWLARIAYLNTTKWKEHVKHQLQNEEKLFKSKNNKSVTLSIARVLLQCSDNKKENLSSYSRDKKDLKLLINTLRNNPQTHESAFAMSLLLTLCLRDTNLDLRQSATKFLQGGKNITFEFNQFIESQPPLQLCQSQDDKSQDTITLRNKVFIDLRHTCWDDLNLETIDFSGTNLTNSTLKKSTQLSKARYTCFHHVDAKQLTFKEGADCTGSHWHDVNLSEAKGNSVIFEWGCLSRVTAINTTFLNAKTKALYKGKKNKGKFIETLKYISPEEEHSFETSNKNTHAKQPPPHVMKYAQHRAQWGLSQMIVLHLLQATEHLSLAINNFIHLLWLLHLSMAHVDYGAYFERESRCQTNKLGKRSKDKASANQQYKKGLQWLLKAWTLNPKIISSLQPTSPTINEKMLGIQNWKKLFTAFTLKHHQHYYTSLCDTSSHTNDNPDEYKNLKCIEYLNFVEALWPNDTELYNTLLNIPNTVGYRQSERIAYETLAASIQRLCRSPQSEDITSHHTVEVNQDKALPCIEIRCHSVGNQRLLPSIVQELVEHKLLDINTGEFKPPQKKKTKQQTENIKSQHRVIRIDCDAHGIYLSSEPDVPRHAGTLGPGYVSLHLKIHPDLPMMDYTTDIFNRRLIGHGSPANEFVVLTVIQAAKDNQPAYSKRYPVLISQTVEGMNLKHVLANHPEQIEYLDNKSTSEFFIAEVLKHPGDGFSRNYVIKQQSPTTTQIVSVDNSQMFVEPIAKTSAHSRQKHKELQERSIIYCLPSIMQKPLNKRALNTITAIRDVTKLLTAWLKTVAAREAHYTAFLTKEDIKQWNAQRKKNNPFIPHALFRTGAISLLAMQLRYLQSLFRFREQRSKKIIIKPTLVMNKLNPRVLKYYTTINKKSGHQALTREAAFKKATGAIQSMSSSEATRAILGDVPDRASIQQQFNQLKETAKMSSLVHKAQDELNYLGEQLLADLKGKQAFNITDKGDWELRVDFQPPREKLSKKRSSVRRRKHAHKADTNHKANTQPVTAKLQNLTLGQKEWLNTLLVKRATFKTLVLSHCIGLDDPTLVGLIRNSQRLAYLDITGCQQITQESLRELANHCKELRILKASRTGIVDATRETGLFQSSRLLHFPKLNKLHLSDCAQKKASRPIIRLTRIALDAPELETLKSNNNASLRSVELPNAIHLTDLNLENNAQLAQLKIPAKAKLIILNIAGCELLTEEQITFDSRLLTTLHIEKRSLLAHGDFRQQYPSLFTALSWPHYTESFVETLSTTLREALTTKGETIQWNQLPIKTRETLHGALYAWGKTGQSIIPALLNALKDKEGEGDVRQSAALALAQCHEHFSEHVDSVIPALLNALKDKKGDVRDSTALALTQCHEHFSGHIDSVIPAFLTALMDKKKNIRDNASQALAQCAQHHQDSVIPMLLIALKDKDENVRKSAALALAKCHKYLSRPFDSVIPALINTLKDNNEDVRNRAALALAKCHEHFSGYIDFVIPPLLNALKDNNEDVRNSAAKTLAKCHESFSEHIDSVIPALLNALKDNNGFVRKCATQALAQCHKHLSGHIDSVIPALLNALKDHSWDVRDNAAQALAKYAQHHKDSVIPALLNALKDNDWNVRDSAAQALAKCHEHLSEHIDSVIPALLNALKDNDWNVRDSATQALAQCHKHLSGYIDSVIPVLLNALKDKERHIRNSAAKDLAKCHKHLSGHIDSVIPALLNALEDNNGVVRQSATQALAKCHEHLSDHIDSVIPALLNALKDNNGNVRQSATQALAKCHKHLSEYIDSVIPALLNALKDNRGYVRDSAALALAKCAQHHKNSVIPALLAALKDKAENSCKSAALALAKCHEHLSEHIDFVISTLLNALKDDDWDVRDSAALALAKCAQHHKNSVIPALLNALKDNNGVVRHSTALALAQCHEHLRKHIDSVIPELLIALKDNDWNVRDSAVRALVLCHEHLSGHIDSVIPALLNTLKDKKRYVHKSAAQALGTIGSINTLQSWIKHIFNEYSVNSESEKTFQQQPTLDNVAPYSSIVTQQASAPPAELLIYYNASKNRPEEGVQHETAYYNNEI